MIEQPPDPGKVFGFGSKEDQARYYDKAYIDQNAVFGRHVDTLKNVDFFGPDMGDKERLLAVEVLRSTQMDPQITFHNILQHNIETYRYKTEFYSFQNQVLSVQRQQEMFEGAYYGVREGLPANERLLGMQTVELIRHKSALNIAEWALPYKALYYGGMDSMGILPQRGGQLFLGDMSRVLQGARAEWVNTPPEELKELDPAQQPEVEVNARKQEIEKWKNVKDHLPMVDKETGETMSDKYARYFADTDFFLRAIGEMNTYNSTIKDDEIHLTETMQEFLGQMMQRRSITYENGDTEDMKDSTRKITVYVDGNGNQLLFQKDKEGNPIRPGGDDVHEVTQYVEVLDPYNKVRTEEEMKYLICAISAMAIHRAKDVLDGLAADFKTAKTEVKPRLSEDDKTPTFDRLFSAVKKTALHMMRNFDAPPKKNFDYMLARSAYYLADSLAFGSFDIAERGGSYSWKMEPVYEGPKKNNDTALKDRKILGYRWETEASQGDPTASGDAFSALKPHLHDAIYAVVKSRVSSFGEGLNLAINHDDGEKMVEVFMTKAAELNDRARTIDMLARGRDHQYLVTYFGILGAFKDQLGHLPAWQEGVAKREKFGKKVNANFSKAVEEYVVFIPTPFDFSHITNEKVAEYAKHVGMTGGQKVIYPMLHPQQKIGLFDMLSTSAKDKKREPIAVADLLRKTWKNVGTAENPKWKSASPAEGGRRLTIKQVNWEMYGRYAEDGRAVNDNFMVQLYNPTYGPLNPKQLDLVQANPKAAISTYVKFADIGFRWVAKEFKKPNNSNNPDDEGNQQIYSGPRVLRQSLEIMHGSPLVFQQLALGVHGLVGRGAAESYQKFVQSIVPGEETDKKTNLYTTLRAAEDLIPEKQGYNHYSDTWCVSLIAQTEAMKPVALASNEMAWETTKKFSFADPTDRKDWKTIVEKEKAKQTAFPRIELG
jgi:hypothetical protein